MQHSLIHLTAISTFLTIAGHTAVAQVMVPAPGATPASPAFTPPPPPPPPQPQPAPEPEMAVPDLVSKDAGGKLVMLGLPTEEAAVLKMGIKADQQSKFDQIRKERSALYDRHLTTHLKDIMALRDVTPMINEPADLGSTIKWLIPARAAVLPMQLSKMLTGAGVISTREAEVVQKAVDGYVKAATDQVKTDFKDKTMEQGVEVARFNFKRMSVEPVREFDRMALTLANNWTTVKTGLGELTPEATAAAAAMTGTGDSKAKVEGAVTLLKALPPETAAKALEAVWAPLPANRLVPDSALQPQVTAPTRPPAGISARPIVVPANAPGGAPGAAPGPGSGAAPNAGSGGAPAPVPTATPAAPAKGTAPASAPKPAAAPGQPK